MRTRRSATLARPSGRPARNSFQRICPSFENIMAGILSPSSGQSLPTFDRAPHALPNLRKSFGGTGPARWKRKPMAYSFAHYCPNCRVPHEVFVDEAHRPEGLPSFHYRCPQCQDQVTYAPFLFLSKSAIPLNAVVATRHATETSEGMAREPSMPDGGCDSRLTPLRAEPSEHEIPAARKGPLSSLGAKKTFTSDTSP